MNLVELLTVEDCFQIGDVGVVILPDFSVPNGRWSSRVEAVVVVKPDGYEFKTTARFDLSHFNFTDPKVSIDRRWRVTILFQNKTKEDVPVGSKILVSHEIRDALLSKNIAS